MEPYSHYSSFFSASGKVGPGQAILNPSDNPHNWI